VWALLRRLGSADGKLDRTEAAFLVVRVLEMDWTAMVEAPLKLLVTGLPDGTVSVRMADPVTAFGRYGNSALASFGKELAETCQRMIGASI